MNTNPAIENFINTLHNLSFQWIIVNKLDNKQAIKKSLVMSFYNKVHNIYTKTEETLL